MRVIVSLNIEQIDFILCLFFYKFVTSFINTNNGMGKQQTQYEIYYNNKYLKLPICKN